MKKVPDKQKASSIIKSAKDDFDFTINLKISKESSNTIIRNIYESFRMLGEALLVNKGVGFIDHIKSIKELLKINVETSRPIHLIENLRKLRHNINYYGYKSDINEANNVISLAKACFNPLFKEVNKIIKTK